MPLIIRGHGNKNAIPLINGGCGAVDNAVPLLFWGVSNK